MLQILRRSTFLWVLLLTLQAPAWADTSDQRVHAIASRLQAHRDVIRELVGMNVIALEWRDQFLALWRIASPAEREQLRQASARELSPIDKANTARLRELLPAGNGWFTISEYGRRASEAAFTIVQHSGDTALMREALRRMEPLVGTAEIDGQGYAMMYDRLAVSDGRPQRYGSQGSTCVGGHPAIPDDLEDPSHVDERRTRLGMQPMAQYLEALERTYGPCHAGDPGIRFVR